MTTDAQAQTDASKVMTFTPSKEEFKDFSRYIAYMESQGAHKAGMAKVIPPKGWKPRRTYDDIDDLVIPAPIQQVVTGQSGLFTQYNIQKKPMTVHEFRKTSNLDKFCIPRYVDFDELERKFWKNLTFNPPLYGADVSGTLYDPDVTEWNIGCLNTILDTVESESGIKIKGVNTPYLYFGMWKSAFAWHTEDMDLYSINYLHFGEPKSWYVVPPEQGKRLERLAKGFFPGNNQSCEAFLRHKMTLISPSILKKYGIPYEKVNQDAGQFVVTFPFAYHAGFNHGYNCAESTNFATKRWIDYGKQATLCSCRQDSVKISMDVFVRKFQPERYKLWKAGKDTAPIDHCKPTPEAAEFLKDEQTQASEAVSEDSTSLVQEDSTDPVKEDNSGPVHEDSTDTVKEDSTDLVNEDNSGLVHEDSTIPVKEDITDPVKEDITDPIQEDITDPIQEDITDPIQEDITDEDSTIPVKEDITDPVKEDITDPIQEDITDPIQEDITDPIQEDITDPVKEDITDPIQEDVTDPVKEDIADPVKEDKSPKTQTGTRTRTGTKRQLEVAEDVKPEVTVKETEEVESKRAKLSRKESPAKVPVKPEKDAVNIKSEPKKEKDTKQLTKSQSKASAKKGSNRRSPSKKEKSSEPAADVCPPEPVESQTVALSSGEEVAAGRVEPPLDNACSPAQKQFQRTLSPADVLHVHSYAKGDYGEGDVPLKEDKKTEEDDDDSEAVQDSKAVAEEASEDGEVQSETDLGQLPGHHPLIKDGMSDDEAPEVTPPVEEGGLEGENWAKPLTHLWQSRPPNLKKEREYNQRMGSKPPYCSICLLFHTYQQTERANTSNSPVMAPGGRMRTKPLIPEMCFTTTTEDDAESEEQYVTPHLEEDGTSLLISCSQCSIRVHTSCYGVDPASVSKEWKCARCKANAMTENCCLCSLRGGALQRANNSKWVHVLCALAVLEARFVNVTERSPVDLSGIPLQRFKLKCYYCKKRMKKASGCCVQCSHGRCPTAYHPTCAQAAGVLMQPDEWPFVVHVTCCRHKGPAQIERNKAAMHELTVGQRVICKHKNGRYYQCDVVQLSKETFYEVNFDDGSFSDNLFPEDIVSRDCAQLGPPPQGEVVQVRWTDGLVYGAKFVASHVIQMYLVEFEDGSQLTAKRDDVYTLDEELPKRVKSRLSKASDMRFDGIFEEKEIIKASKRQRVINSRYRGDYIEPVIYRAIME
ncbi:lysine-specific demethylase 4A isoform X2 [Solea senegalensis]|uniref:[histone H3]-trimethyl-L-lysine(9) demethylase n=1 Tax=Solea senegalensis TaxID=28829 RepID=A0AAV6SAM3_SOLSE|nr:lysine-specific demethylase 4A isoform X2 [Solea senegalensis]